METYTPAQVRIALVFFCKHGLMTIIFVLLFCAQNEREFQHPSALLRLAFFIR